jgi:DNA excision repair protein ERCC-2
MKSVVSALQGLARREPLSLATEEPTTSVDEILHVLRRSPHTLINAVAGGKLVEGVEYYIDGVNVLGTVFVAGVPYPQPDDYMKDRLKAIAARTGDPSIEFELYEEEAILRARQAIGRALRDPQRDRALIVLADTRYLRRSIQRKLRLHYDRIAYTIDEYRDAVWRAAQSLGA